MMLDGMADPQFGESILRALLAHLRSCRDATGLNSLSYGGLAPWQQRLAKTVLGMNLLHPTPLGEVAARRRLSASHAPGTGADAGGTAEYADHVALIGEAAGERDI